MRLILLITGLLCTGALAAEPLSDDIASLKADVAGLNHTLFQLEEDILNPANTQVAVYLSFDARDYFVLDSVELALDGHSAVSHLYSERERKALEQGGVQRLYLGNLAAGEHELSAVFNGQGANDHYYRKEASFTIQKATGKAQYELVIDARAPSFEPAMRIKQWD